MYVCVGTFHSKHWQFRNGAGGGWGGGRNKNGTLMRSGYRLVRAFTIPLEKSSCRRGGLVAIARVQEGWWF